AIGAAGLPEAASYAVAMAYRMRFYMEMNAREAMHVIELRTAPQGHPSYRRVCQAMHRLIADQAGPPALAAAMTFADHSEVALERLEAERAAERRRAGRRSNAPRVPTPIATDIIGRPIKDDARHPKETSVSPKVGMGPVRREQIVRATVKCLAREGYTRLTMKKVARQAGVSQGILHYYFADKRAMLAATLEVVTRDLDRRVAAAQSRTSREPAARLRALVRACLDVAVRCPEFWVVFVEFWGEMLHDRRLRDL